MIKDSYTLLDALTPSWKLLRSLTDSKSLLPALKGSYKLFRTLTSSYIDFTS